MDNKAVLKMIDVSKSFSGVKVLQHVSLDVRAGEVHALLGENGAGKSTLIKVLGGIINCDEGKILIDDKEVQIHSVADAKANGISIIHQELSLATNLTIAENIYMGQECSKHGFLKKKLMNENVQKFLDEMGLNLAADTLVGTLSIARQQSVEIAKALFFNARIIVMDEPTASLTEAEVSALFESIKQLKAKGVSIIYISHRLDELFIVSERVTVLRDGKYIGTVNTAETNRGELIALMVGRDMVNDMYVGKRPVGGDTVLEVKNLSNEVDKNISFALKKGEILGFSGLVGAGRTELFRSICGLDPKQSGTIILDGEEIKINNPKDAIDKGIVMIPEDRKKQGLILMNTIAFNMTIPVVDQFIHGISVNKKKEKEIVDEYVNQLSIKMASTEQNAAELSGGNQQKIVISKWLAANPRIIIMDEPTRGIDVGAKSEIYHLMYRLAESGISIILISSELPEIINTSSRIAVMSEGMITKIFDLQEGEVTQEMIMHYSTIEKEGEANEEE